MSTTKRTLRVGDLVISSRHHHTAVVTAVYPEDSTWGRMIAIRYDNGREVSDWMGHWSLIEPTV